MRQQLSSNTPLFLSRVIVALAVFTLIWAVLSFFDESRQFSKALAFSGAIGSLVFSRRISKVSIDDEYLYVQKFYREIKVRPEEIDDVNFWRLSNYLVLTFKSTTIFGSYVIFEPKGGDGLMDVNLKGAEAFETIGRFCGWKS